MFVPVAVSTVATAIIFNWLLDPTYGLANWFLNELGFPSQGFFTNPDQAMYGIVAMTVWGWLGFDVIIYLAALQGIPQELLEAAAIDGAGRWATFRSVDAAAARARPRCSWSSGRRSTRCSSSTRSTSPRAAGPLGATTVVVYYLYQQAFQFFEAGYAAAIAYVLFIAILVITVDPVRDRPQDGALHLVKYLPVQRRATCSSPRLRC